MKNIEGIIYLFLIAIISAANGSWHEIFVDDFNGTQINGANWDYDEGCDGWGNDELECYTVERKENARVENGHLLIQVHVEEYKGKHYTSARLTSKKHWAYGKFEAKARLPKGKHLWPAIWLMPFKDVYGGWPASGEIDIMESRGERSNQAEFTIHYGGDEPNFVSKGSEVITFPFDFSTDYHIFSFEWDHNEVRWLVDNKQYHKESINHSLWSGKGRNPYTKPGQPFDQPFYWIFNIAVGGNFFPENEFGKLTVEEAKKWAKPTMEVDYVKVYEWKE